MLRNNSDIIGRRWMILDVVCTESKKGLEINLGNHVNM